MNKENFKIGDLVSVSGGSIGKDGETSNTAEICIVAAVGQYDLIVEATNLQSAYQVPKKLCNIIKIEPTLLKNCNITKPDLGDLVVSFKRKFYTQEEPEVISGVLYKVDYKLGKASTCTLLCGSEFVEVAYDTIVLVQQK